MPSSPFDSRFQPHLHPLTPGNASVNSDENHVESPKSNNGSKLGLFDRLMPGSARRKASSGSTTQAGAGGSNSSTENRYSPLGLAQRIRALLDSHPVNSPPPPSFQPLPTPDSIHTPLPFSPVPFSPVPFPGSPLPAQPYEQLPFSPGFSSASNPQSPCQAFSSPPQLSQDSTPTAYFSAQLPSSPADAELIALLSSPEFMNGSLLPTNHDTVAVPDPLLTPIAPAVHVAPNSPSLNTPKSPGRRQTVWNILDRIGSPRARAKRLSRATEDTYTRERRESLNGYPASPLRGHWPTSPAMSSISSVLAASPTTAAYGSDGMRDIEEESTEDDEDDTSMMLYSPLIPNAMSLVSIADSEMVSVVAVHEDDSDSDEERTERTIDAPSAPEQTETGGWGFSNLWPFASWFSSSSANSTQPAGTAASSNSASQQQPSTALPSTAPTSPRQLQSRVRRRRIWVPSRTQLSLETMWWGYRIYIPPPVLEALDSTSVETNRRAALLTAALTWFFTNFPVNVLPPPVRPVIIILQGLVPYLGYLGGLLSWSWGTIRSYDEGYGIILTATWLVPIALIPSTWVAPPPDWPGSPSSTIAPLPPSTPASQSTDVPNFSSYPTSPYSLSPSRSASPQGYQRELEQVQRQEPMFPVYSPYSQMSALSPLPRDFSSFPTSVPNANPYPYPYGHQILISTPMMPVQTNGVGVYSPVAPAIPTSPASSYGIATEMTIPPSQAPSSPPVSTRKRRSKRIDRQDHGSLSAPRMATVPLPDDV